MNEKIVDRLEQIGIVPVIVLEDAKHAVPLAKALMAGGLPCAEITFRTKAAKEAIKQIRENCPDMLVGAGTVLNCDQAKEAIEAGAQFIVSPGINAGVVRFCQEKQICVIPGCANPTNVEMALELGLNVVKFFPAQQAGGVDMMKAMSAPYPGVRFMPTGGINEKNINEYLAYSKVVACGGSFMVKRELIEKEEFEKITKLTQKAVSQMLSLHVEPMSMEDGKAVTFSTPNVKRLVFHMNRQGLQFNSNSEIYHGDRLVSIETMSDQGPKICFTQL